jgi:hypothetical protein
MSNGSPNNPRWRRRLEELQKALGERDRALADKAQQVAALRDEQLQLRKEREKLKDEKAALALEVQKQVDEQLQRRESIVRAQEQQRGQLEKAELQKKLDDAGEQLAAAQRKMEQGSQQLQGEVLELVIEEGLRRAFPLDAIEEVKKGQRGGDVLQRVITRGGQAAGTILWETKRAKEWSPQWIAKLKEDMRASGAAVGILGHDARRAAKGLAAGCLFRLVRGRLGHPGLDRDSAWPKRCARAAWICIGSARYRRARARRWKPSTTT